MVRDLVQRGWRHPAGHSGDPLPRLGVQGGFQFTPGQWFMSSINTSGELEYPTLFPFPPFVAQVAYL